MGKTLNIGGRLYDISSPKIMGIINVTPDSFYAASRVDTAEAVSRAVKMVESGAHIIDLGGYSTRPGAEEISPEEEMHRLLPAIEAIKTSLPDIPLSIDTFRADVARECVAAGADIINDIGGGTLDDRMFEEIARLKVPYVLMHTRGTPATMQQHTDYKNVSAEVLEYLAFKTSELRSLGVTDIIVDPGFGFAKTIEQNFRLLDTLSIMKELDCPVLAGLSRKTMIWKTLDITPSEALNGTTALNMVALMNGADILRVHDVKEAAEALALFEALKNNSQPLNRIYDSLRH